MRQTDRRRNLGAAIFAALAFGIWAVPGQAAIEPPTVLGGPSNDILEVDGAALAPDGSGGIVYRARGTDGRPHVYVEQFLNGEWLGPYQVDTSDPYGASMPAIAAGDGGMLLVVWVQPRALSASGMTLYSLMAASQQPGASGFGQAVTVDPNVGEPYVGDISPVEPQLAMDPASGQAYVVYRVARNDCKPPSSVGGDPPSSLCLPGDELLEVRVALFSYLRWSLLGAVNRAPAQVAMRAASPSNRPAIGIDAVSGDGLVAWQEPDSSGVARIWARRIFGQTLGNVLAVSPATLEGRPVASDAEAPVVAMSPFGEARVAFRIAADAATPPRLYLNAIENAFESEASQFTGPVPVADLPSTDGIDPAVAIDQGGDYRLTWVSRQTVFSAEGEQKSTGRPAAIGASTGGVAPTTIDPAGGDVTSWLGEKDGADVVDVRQDYPDGGSQLAQLAGTLPGSVEGFAMAGSGRGDALLGWTEGVPGRAQVIADFVQAPPGQFNVIVPRTWVPSQRASVSWEATPDATPGVRYAVYVDGRPRLGGIAGLSASLGALALGDGLHRIRILATDAAGQQTTSSSGELKVDANPPLVQVLLIDRRHGVLVTVASGTSGVDRGAIAIAFGDGHFANRRASVRHRYARAGAYTITARVRDLAGTGATERIRVKVA